MSITTPQYVHDTNSAKKVWKKPEVFILDSNDIEKNPGAYHEKSFVRDGPNLLHKIGNPGFTIDNFSYNAFASS
jgi:hypothetical protein